MKYSSLVDRLTSLVSQREHGSVTGFLTDTIRILEEELPVDIVVCYELIPETGGMPRVPPLYAGSLAGFEVASSALCQVSPAGLIGQFVSRWKPDHYALDSACGYRSPLPRTDTYAAFMQSVGLSAVDFFPLSSGRNKLAALLLNYRANFPFSDDEHHLTSACTALIETGLTRTFDHTNSRHTRQRRMATAHTLYNEIASQFRGQILMLEEEIQRTLSGLNTKMPAELSHSIEAAKQTVFELMRDLVIRASGDVLVDLRQMDLHKALRTVAAALERAWPPTQHVKIDIHPVPAVIDRQTLELRQLLYALVVETMGNAIKHGGPAPYTSVNIRWANRHVYVQVIDHGVGFEPSAVHLSEYGLGFWKQLVEDQLCGTFAIASAPGHGTVVTVSIPVIPFRRGYDASSD